MYHSMFISRPRSPCLAARRGRPRRPRRASSRIEDGLEGDQEALRGGGGRSRRGCRSRRDVGAVGAEGDAGEEPRTAIESSTKRAAAEQRGEEALAGDRLPGGLVDAADVGDDEDVEDHHGAGVDDDLGGGDEGRGRAAGRARRARTGGRSAPARCRTGCAGRRRRSRRRGRRSRRRRRATASIYSPSPLQRSALDRLGEQHLLGEDQVGRGRSRPSRSRGPS